MAQGNDSATFTNRYKDSRVGGRRVTVTAISILLDVQEAAGQLYANIEGLRSKDRQLERHSVIQAKRADQIGHH